MKTFLLITMATVILTAVVSLDGQAPSPIATPTPAASPTPMATPIPGPSAHQRKAEGGPTYEPTPAPKAPEEQE